MGLTLVGLSALPLAAAFGSAFTSNTGFDSVFDFKSVFASDFKSAFAELEFFFTLEFLVGVLVATIRKTSREHVSC